MKAIAISTHYMSNKAFIIWEIPHDKITGYEIYRDNNLIASSLVEDETKVIFEQPTLFDHDHHTNLFRKDSTYKLMYVDVSVKSYEYHTYKVIAKKLDDSNNIKEIIESDDINIQIQ